MDIYDNIGVGPARDEAENSRLPGLLNGPGDAYRHIIGAAEMTRRHGEPAARAMLEVNEIRGDYLRGQSQDERETDEHNNEIGIAIGRESHTYEEIVKRAREKIDTSVPHNGSGAEGSPKWLKESQWGEAGGNNWPPNWSDVTPAKDYEYGGEEHRYGPRTDADPMERPVDTWSEDDVRRVMSSDAYQRQADPGHKLAQDKVRGWFGHFYGDAPARRDATGRMIDPTPVRPIPTGGGPVQVRAHAREGGKVSVDAHDRSRPSR